MDRNKDTGGLRLGVVSYLLTALAPSWSSAAEPAPAAQAEAEVEQTIVVSGRKLIVKTLVDRKVYDVTDDVQAAFGTVSDVLSVLPSVDVDPDDSISYRGDGNVLILIDGKPSALLSGATAGDNLKAIPARDIERIEVISTPPAQFKASGATGIINIVLRKKRPDGFAGNLQASYGDRGRMFAGADFSYRKGALTAAANAGFRRDVRSRTISSEVRVAESLLEASVDERSELNERAHRQIPSAGLRAEYELSDSQSVSAAATWLKRGGLRRYNQLNSTTSAGDVLASSERQSVGRDPETEFDGRLGYLKKFQRDGEELALSVHRSDARQREHYEYTGSVRKFV